MIPYSRQIITKKDKKKVNLVLGSHFITQGKLLEKFEKSLASRADAKYATGFNSATSALHISCLALGVKKNDIVWTCTNSFVASANCALYCGAKIDLIDINNNDFNINIDDLEKKLLKAKRKGKLPKVLIPVHFGGRPCDMGKIFKLSKKYKFKIIEDASHALGAKYKGKKIGSCKFSDITVFSFHPVKIITTVEGGAALSNSKQLDQKLKLLRNHGIIRDKRYLKKKRMPLWYYEFQELGFNYRLNEIQAALGISQLEKLNKWVSYRNQLADIYREKLKNLPIYIPPKKRSYYSSYHLFVIIIKKNKKNLSRDDVFNLLKKNNIQSNVHYIPIHTQPFYKKLGFKNKNYPEMTKYFNRCLSLPMYAGLTRKKQNKVINILRRNLI
jgi:UDP-4-amino-4,6-dideoxy-N-acetyl-beta-L-altrosamine transaminase